VVVLCLSHKVARKKLVGGCCVYFLHSGAGQVTSIFKAYHTAQPVRSCTTMDQPVMKRSRVHSDLESASEAGTQGLPVVNSRWQHLPVEIVARAMGAGDLAFVSQMRMVCRHWEQASCFRSAWAGCSITNPRINSDGRPFGVRYVPKMVLKLNHRNWIWVESGGPRLAAVTFSGVHTLELPPTVGLQDLAGLLVFLRNCSDALKEIQIHAGVLPFLEGTFKDPPLCRSVQKLTVQMKESSPVLVNGLIGCFPSLRHLILVFAEDRALPKGDWSNLNGDFLIELVDLHGMSPQFFRAVLTSLLPDQRCRLTLPSADLETLEIIGRLHGLEMCTLTGQENTSHEILEALMRLHPQRTQVSYSIGGTYLGHKEILRQILFTEPFPPDSDQLTVTVKWVPDEYGDKLVYPMLKCTNVRLRIAHGAIPPIPWDKLFALRLLSLEVEGAHNIPYTAVKHLCRYHERLILRSVCFSPPIGGDLHRTAESIYRTLSRHPFKASIVLDRVSVGNLYGTSNRIEYNEPSAYLLPPLLHEDDE
jgi:hypothetical protein